MPIDTFLFDLDGTLVDSVGDLTTALNLLRGELDLPPLDLPTVRSYVGDGATQLVQRALPEELFSDRHLQRFLTLYGTHLLDQTAPYPGIRELLERQSGHNMAVVTNKPLVLARQVLDGLGLSRYFPVVIGGDSLPEKKPHPAPLLAALTQLAAVPHSAVMIGDHHTDLKAGRAAGIRTCFCTWGLGHNGGIPSDFQATTPAELQSLFTTRA